MAKLFNTSFREKEDNQYRCPTCGSKVKIGGGDGSTHYYIPVEEESQDQDELWLQLLEFIWQNNDKTPLKLIQLKSKFTITKK